MKKVAWIRLVALALALFFIAGSIANIAAPAPVRADYAHWGYPEGFHYLTGFLEITAAILLARQQTRRLGVLLGLVLMGAAFSTHLLNSEPTDTIAPALAFASLLGLGLAMNRHTGSPRKRQAFPR